MLVYSLVHSLQILDVGQAVIHNQLTLGIVVASENETATAFGNERDFDFST
ncbi:ACT domain-containing protein [Staphylococcus aureus]|uniref:ACT domain-containing protein n=1 Tax=Staphylococcus aureus TaxID=1280 RepID=UPI0034D275B1